MKIPSGSKVLVFQLLRRFLLQPNCFFFLLTLGVLVTFFGVTGLDAALVAAVVERLLSTPVRVRDVAIAVIFGFVALLPLVWRAFEAALAELFLLLLNALHELVIAIVFRVIISFVHVHHPHLFLLIVLETVVAVAAILFSACFGRREDSEKA
jgi:hypothetical protein